MTQQELRSKEKNYSNKLHTSGLISGVVSCNLYSLIDTSWVHVRLITQTKTWGQLNEMESHSKSVDSVTQAADPCVVSRRMRRAANPLEAVVVLMFVSLRCWPATQLPISCHKPGVAQSNRR